MREIKFRGKRLLDNNFVYGDLITLHDGRFYIVDNKFGACIDIHGTFVNTEYPFVNLVIPETIGQYTGLKDKNGVGIYEGDIIEAWSQGYKARGEVKQRIDGYWLMYPAWQSGKSWTISPYKDGSTNVVVVGNIHENKIG